jgi:CDP-4-dehydro-6-deoxyglucose reductase
MKFNVLIQPSGHSFPIETNETLLDAAARHGFNLPYGCRNGACGVCKGKVLAGTVDHGQHVAGALTASEMAAGQTLFCCARATSDLVIESKEIGAVSQIPVRMLPSRVERMEKLAPDVMALWLKLPANEQLQFFAGQYIDILTKEGKPRSFSLANAPHEGELLELHIRNIAGGSFTQFVFNELRPRDILRFKGPLGTFFLREDGDRPIIFVASGTGFAPIKAIIEHALYIDLKRPMHFYWGARTLADLYLLERAQAWEARGIRFTPVLSDALPEDRWSGRSGFVHKAVMDDYPDLAGHQVYACGAPVVVEAAHRDFTSQRGLPEDQFFSDAFTFAAKV